jgi:hypothetical protein
VKAFAQGKLSVNKLLIEAQIAALIHAVYRKSGSISLNCLSVLCGSRAPLYTKSDRLTRDLFQHGIVNIVPKIYI